MRPLFSAVLLALAAACASAHADTATPSERLWLEQVSRKLEAQGFEVRAARIGPQGLTLEATYGAPAEHQAAAAATGLPGGTR